MKTPPRRKRAFIMVELLFLLLPAMIVFGLLMAMLLDFIAMQRLAGEHNGRMVAIDSLCGALRADIRSARKVAWVPGQSGAGTISLISLENAQIEYRIEEDRVTRITAASEDNVWSASRLQFAGELQTVGNGRLFQLVLNELPPAMNSTLPARRYSKSFLLSENSAVQPGAIE